jgi:hypothetical protein
MPTEPTRGLEAPELEAETRVDRTLRYLLIGLLAFQGLFIGLAPFGVLVARQGFQELRFRTDGGSEVEINTVLIAALFGFMAMICFYGALLLWHRRRGGAVLGILTGIYLVYVGATPALLLDRTDYLLVDVPRGIATMVLGLLLLRRLDQRSS